MSENGVDLKLTCDKIENENETTPLTSPKTKNSNEFSVFETGVKTIPFLSRYWNDWLFPSDVPQSCQLLRIKNLVLPASYLVVGLLQGFSGPLINVYPLEMNASEAQQATISGLRSFPASFKILFGFLSDTMPLFGYRRKIYMLFGWCLSAFSMGMLLQNSDCGFAKNGETQPSIEVFSLSVLLFGSGFWFADVMADAVVAEKAKLEPKSSFGRLQSTCYACRFFGSMIAYPFSSIIYSTLGPRMVIYMLCMLPLVMLPLTVLFWETQNQAVNSTHEQCQEIWKTVCSRAVWQPMGFVYLYNVLQVNNAAWRQYLTSVLGFTADQLNSLLVIAYVLLFVGVMAYKCYFMKWSWRMVYVFTTLLGGFFSLLQISLLKGYTFGLSPFLFSLGDDAFGEFVSGIQFLPTIIMMAHLCPVGSEGASYAMFTTVNNSALALSSALTTLLLGIWDVSKETMVAGELSGMIKLTLLTTLFQVSGILFVRLLPRSTHETESLKSDNFSQSTLGGSIFLSITFSSILYSIFVMYKNVVHPGWVKGS